VGRRFFVIIFLALSLAGWVGCAPGPVPAQELAAQPGLQEMAAVEATAIIEQARATAMVLKAQTEATALILEAGATAQTPTPDKRASEPVVPTDERLLDQSALTSDAALEDDGEEDEYHIELINVGFAAEGGYIIINFRASIHATHDLWPGRMSVTDEASGIVYNEVPSMPVIGPLIGRPVEDGQVGYVMLVNKPPGLPPGALVTVQLGQFMQTHVKLEN
jgi:hypothetical protein